MAESVWRKQAWAEAKLFWKQQRHELRLKRAKAFADKAKTCAQHQLGQVRKAFGVDSLSEARLPMPIQDFSVEQWGKRTDAVYVIWPEGDRFVKIGYSNDFDKRIGELQVGNPRLLWPLVVADCKLTKWSEDWMHQRFAEYHERGEWFRLEGSLREWLLPPLTKLQGFTGGFDGQG